MLSEFKWTNRCRPVVEVGIDDVRTPSGNAHWDSAHWDTVGSHWAGTEPTWVDVTCNTRSYQCAYGRGRTVDRFVAGLATVTVSNITGWADPPDPTDLSDFTVRPGRAIRMGVDHQVYGRRWLFRGFIDAVVPVYDPTEADIVELDCIDALGEVNRAKFIPQDEVAGAGETVTQRIDRLLDLGLWATNHRDLQPTSETLVADDFSGQLADLLGQAAESGAGVVFGDLEGRIAFRPRDWQTYTPDTPVDGTIGNVAGTTTVGNRVTFDEDNYLFFGDQVIYGTTVGAGSDVCPVRWERPFERADIATRVIVGREGDETSLVQLDDDLGQRMYGIEPFQRTDLLSERDDMLELIAARILATRSHTTAPRVRTVSLDARTADNALDLMATVDVYKPSRYRCRLEYPRGVVFDGEYFATGVAHEVTPTSWTLEMNLDVAEPFAIVGERWDSGHWDESTWADDPVRKVQETAA